MDRFLQAVPGSRHGSVNRRLHPPAQRLGCSIVPVHLGDPALIGISDIGKPDFGDAVAILPDELPVFWACGVTPQAVVAAVQPDFCITHAPGYMLITDLLNSDLALA